MPDACPECKATWKPIRSKEVWFEDSLKRIIIRCKSCKTMFKVLDGKEAKK